MKKFWPILAAILFCVQAFVACSNSELYYAADVVIEAVEPDSILKDTVEADTTATDTAEVDTAEVDTAEVDTTAPADTTSPADTTKADSIASGTFDHRIATWGVRTPYYINLLYPVDSFLAEFEIGDIVTVEIAGYDTLEMPVVESISDVPLAGLLVSARAGSDYVSLGINYGSFSDIIGLTDENDFIELVVTLKEKGGYLQGLEIMRTAMYMDSYKESYPDLSIAEFANFREVRTKGMGEHKLYRSSSPIYMYLGRNYYADSLAKEAGVATFINFADLEDGARSYKGFETTYYSTQNAIFLGVPPEFFSSIFQEGLVKGLRYMIEHEAPYLVHCTYGMDRTGFTIAVLEALMGATVEEIQADYAKTFSNFYYTLVDGAPVALNEQQVDFFKSVVIRNLRAVFNAKGIHVPDTSSADWATATESFLVKLGMTTQEISALKDRLK